MKKLGLLFVLFFLSLLTMHAQQLIQTPVWPGGQEESNGLTGPEETDNEGRIRNISIASITVYPADKKKNTGKAILICPGGGYALQAAKHEGTDFAEWFAANGITAVLLKYRLPNKNHGIPLKDAQEAMRIVRKNAGQWGVDPQQIGVTGFSAGGHLASSLLTHCDSTSRPDFGILFYPVISMKTALTHKGSRTNLLGEGYDEELVSLYSNEDQVKKDTPPTMLLLSDDDKGVIPENSSLFYLALKKYKIPSAMYIFPTGGHGWGFKNTFRYHEEMKSLVLAWLANLKE